MRKIILFFIVFLYFITNINAFDIKSLWTINSYVIDKVWVLNDEEKKEIENTIEDLKKKYTTEIFTIIIDTTSWEDIWNIWTKIWQELWVWKADKDNWVVILIAINDRSWNISTWYWVEWVLPDLLANRIWEKNFVLFKEKRYKDGIIWTLNDFDKAFSWDTSIISNQQNVDDVSWLFIFQFIIALLLSSFIFKPMMNNYKYKKVFLYLLIAYIITLPLAYIAVKSVFFFLQNAFVWLIWFIFWVFWKSGNFGSWKWWWSSRWWGFGWFGWWWFGWWWSSWKW